MLIEKVNGYRGLCDDIIITLIISLSRVKWVVFTTIIKSQKPTIFHKYMYITTYIVNYLIKLEKEKTYCRIMLSEYMLIEKVNGYRVLCDDIITTLIIFFVFN